MSVIAGTLDVTGSVATADWKALAGGDTGEAIPMARWPVRTAQVIGDATSVGIDGSNDGTHWKALTTDGTNAISLVGSSSDIARIYENPKYIRPNVTGGTNSEVIIAGVMTSF